MTRSQSGEHISVEEPVFILGNPRSGTTLFRLVLTAHSEIGIPPESEFIVALFKRYGAVRAFDAPTLEALKSDLGGGRIDLATQWKVDIELLFKEPDKFLGKSYAAVCAQLYREYQTVRGFEETAIWGDKNNAYGNYIDVLSYLYPSARFIHLVRDGRAVLNSYKKLKVDEKQKYAPLLPKDARSVAQKWIDLTGRIDKHLRKYAPERHMTIRYEDLVSEFDTAAKRLCDFLGIEYDVNMQHFDELNRRYELEPREYGWKENTFKPINQARCDSWRTELNDDDIRVFEVEAATALARYGYPNLFGDAGAQASVLRSRILLNGRVREALRAARLRYVQTSKLVKLQ